MSGPYSDATAPSGIHPTKRASFSSGRSHSSSALPSESRRPSQSSNPADPYSPAGSRQHSFSSTTGALPSPGSALSGAGLIFPGPAQGSRPVVSPRQSGEQLGGDDDDEQESLSPRVAQRSAQPAHQAYVPGPPPGSSRRDYLDRGAGPTDTAAAAQQQYPSRPTSRQQSVDTTLAAAANSDIPTFSMPFPPPPSSSSVYNRSPGASPAAQSIDPISSVSGSLSRTHLSAVTGGAAPTSLLHKTPSSSSLSGQSIGGASSAYSYEAASPSPAFPTSRHNSGSGAAAAVEPSPNPSTGSSAYGGLEYSTGGAGGYGTATTASSVAGGDGVGDFARRGEGLGLGRGIMDTPGSETRRPSLATTVGADPLTPAAGVKAAYGAAGGTESDYLSSVGMPAGSHGDELAPTGFDEGVLRALCDMDEASAFLKKRAQIEEEYARSMAKLARSSIESYSVGDGKAGSYVSSWLSMLRTHELLGDNRLKFAAQLGEMSDELAVLGKEVEKSRKATKDLGARLEKGLQEQEGLVDKAGWVARIRFDSAAEELERLLLLKQGETITPSSVPHAGASSSHPSKGRSFGKAMSKLKGPKNPAQVAKQEEEVRSRMGQSSDAYRAQVAGAQAVRQEFFNLQLPKILRSLKESVDELDLGTQYHLSRYAYLFESLLVTDGLTISPVSAEDGPGIKNVVDAIDVREDFKTFMQQFALNWQMSGQRGPRREGPADEGYPSSHNLASFSSASQLAAPTNRTFGVDLGEQMVRDNVDVPRVLEKCAEAIELYGLDSMGIYRLSGTTSRVQRLKASLDRDLEGTDLLSEENLTDINDIAAVLKLWFRELPEPLLTWELYHQFIEIAKIENDRLRHIRLHERVNDLPDPNYATLKFLMGHLDKVAQHESVNQMSVSNLAIVFGPNLLGAPPPHLQQHYAQQAAQAQAQNAGDAANGAGAASGGGLIDMQWQSKAIETILRHYHEIFVE
ncbi:hypothetical protein Rhopal_003463-T1 [Rhodotorula paludigena]|uniref:Rho-GAP domain-containing protein n=1 Tax=Rhodotorula paludigena TaxID=86838 RepID=A0AAV5GLU4_9BASI|nr:hypothetical protein Rhopal_003463-T1 [Rhodotorula paludigena]